MSARIGEIKTIRSVSDVQFSRWVQQAEADGFTLIKLSSDEHTRVAFMRKLPEPEPVPGHTPVYEYRVFREQRRFDDLTTPGIEKFLNEAALQHYEPHSVTSVVATDPNGRYPDIITTIIVRREMQ